MRFVRLLLVSLLLVALSLSAGCRQKMVTVRSGEIVICTEGETVSDTTKEISVPADEVGRYSVKTRIETCDLHKKLAALYADAQKALTDGDLAAAKASLTELLKLNPAYRKAGSQLADINAGKKPAVDGTTSGGSGDTGQNPGTPGEDDPTGPILTLASYTPDSVAGLVGQSLIVDPFTLTRDYLPATPGTMLKAVIVAEQFKDAAAAKAQLSESIKSSYPKSPANVTIAGRSAYFGVNGKVAAAAFVEGSVLVVVEGAAVGDDGAALKSKILEVAGLIGK